MRYTTLPIASTIIGRINSQAVYIGNNNILLTGGSNESTAFTLNLKTFKIKQTNSMKIPRNSHGVIFHKNRVFAIGGYNYRENGCTTKCEVFDIELERWSTIKDMNRKRQNFGVCLLYNE